MAAFRFCRDRPCVRASLAKPETLGIVCLLLFHAQARRTTTAPHAAVGTTSPLISNAHAAPMQCAGLTNARRASARATVTSCVAAHAPMLSARNPTSTGRAAARTRAKRSTRATRAATSSVGRASFVPGPAKGPPTGGSVRRILRAHQTSTYGALVQALGVNAKTGPGVQAHLTFRVPRPQPRGPVWIARSVHVRSTSPTPPLGRRALAAVSRSAAPRSTCRGQHQTQQAYAWTSRHARRTNSLRGVPQQRVVHARCTPPVPRTSTSPSLPPSAGHAPTPRAAAAWNAG